MKLTIVAIALVAGFAFSVQAEEQEHHTTDQSKEKKSERMNHEMMGGKMDMGQMHVMMGDCMKMHNNDGKICEGQMMEQCQKSKGKGDCSQMMKKMKQTN